MLLLIGGRQYPELVLKIAGKVFRVIKADLVGDLGDGEPAFLQQLGGSFKPDIADELDGGLDRKSVV